MSAELNAFTVAGYRNNSDFGKKVLCREIRTTDAEGVISLLTRGFAPVRNRSFWINTWRLLEEHPTPTGLPRFGYMLESNNVPVGIILLISTQVPGETGPIVKSNVSSWYVEPEFRAYATMLISCAFKRKDVTYFNITPAPHTLKTLQPLGFKQYSKGRMVTLPALSPIRSKCRIEAITPHSASASGVSAQEFELLRTHAGYGCISIVCHAEGEEYPFVFAKRRRWGFLPFAFLVYGRSNETFARFAGNLGRYLARRGIPIVIVDANGPIPTLIGTYMDVNPKYYRGPNIPKIGDLSYSERAMFGV